MIGGVMDFIKHVRKSSTGIKLFCCEFFRKEMSEEGGGGLKKFYNIKHNLSEWAKPDKNQISKKGLYTPLGSPFEA